MWREARGLGHGPSSSRYGWCHRLGWGYHQWQWWLADFSWQWMFIQRRLRLMAEAHQPFSRQSKGKSLGHRWVVRLQVRADPQAVARLMGHRNTYLEPEASVVGSEV